MSPTDTPAEPREDAFEAVSKEVERVRTAHATSRAREKRAREHLEAVEARSEGGGSGQQPTGALATARQRADEATRLRREAAARLREANKLLREERQLARETKRRERARERAVTAFLKKWEREYDLEVQRKRKNVELRRRELRRCASIRTSTRSRA